MKHIFQPRTSIYHNAIGQFDYTEKCNVLYLKLIQIPSIKSSWRIPTDSKEGLNTLIFKSCFTQNHFSFQRVTGSFIFKIALQKKRFFCYLESLINFYLIKKSLNPKIGKGSRQRMVSFLRFSNVLTFPFILQVPYILVENKVECNTYIASNHQSKVWLSYYFYS